MSERSVEMGVAATLSSKSSVVAYASHYSERIVIYGDLEDFF